MVHSSRRCSVSSHLHRIPAVPTRLAPAVLEWLHYATWLAWLMLWVATGARQGPLQFRLHDRRLLPRCTETWQN